jgi:hypothetical protein
MTAVMRKHDEKINCSTISLREQVTFQWDDDDLSFVPDQHANLYFINASSLKQQFMACNSTHTYYPDSEPTSFCSYSTSCTVNYLFILAVWLV